MLIAILICLIEAALIAVLVYQGYARRTQLLAARAATAALRTDLQRVLDLVNKQEQTKGEARDEKEALGRTPDAELAGRANVLFRP